MGQILPPNRAPIIKKKKKKKNPDSSEKITSTKHFFNIKK